MIANENHPLIEIHITQFIKYSVVAYLTDFIYEDEEISVFIHG